jgi:hypothetical protein
MTDSDLGFERKTTGYVYGNGSDDSDYDSEGEEYLNEKKHEQDELDKMNKKIDEEITANIKYNKVFDVYMMWLEGIEETVDLSEWDLDAIRTSFFEKAMNMSDTAFMRFKSVAINRPRVLINL